MNRSNKAMLFIAIVRFYAVTFLFTIQAGESPEMNI